MVTLAMGKRSEDYALRELPPEEAGLILKIYLELYPLTKPYFDATLDSSLDEFVADTRSRPVFGLIKIKPDSD